MKVHIALVGGQPAPIYHGIVATNPDKVVFIYSSESIDVLETLKHEISFQTEEISLDPIDPIRIKSAAIQLAENHINDEVTVNISSGLKSWSHLFGVVFENYSNASVVYMDQNNVLWNYKTMQGKSDFAFDMHTVFRLYGNSLENNYKKLADYTDKDVKALALIEKIRLYNIREFNSLVSVLDTKKANVVRNQKYGKFDLSYLGSQSYVEWEKNNGDRLGFVRICLCKKGEFHEITFESEHAVDLTFNSGWFEYKIAKLLSTWSKAKEICINCRFPFRPNVDKNETDIIVNTGTKILFVECKTQITHTTDIDKFRSVVKGYGGTGSKGLFVTDAKMTDVAKKKCEENGIMMFSLQDDHLGMSDESALAMLLDSELFNINKK